jgi:hypothetical protein
VRNIYMYTNHIHKNYREVALGNWGGGVETIGTKAVDTSSCEKSSW